jgi:hypothetical protein
MDVNVSVDQCVLSYCARRMCADYKKLLVLRAAERAADGPFEHEVVHLQEGGFFDLGEHAERAWELATRPGAHVVQSQRRLILVEGWYLRNSLYFISTRAWLRRVLR